MDKDNKEIAAHAIKSGVLGAAIGTVVFPIVGTIVGGAGGAALGGASAAIKQVDSEDTPLKTPTVEKATAEGKGR